MAARFEGRRRQSAEDVAHHVDGVNERWLAKYDALAKDVNATVVTGYAAKRASMSSEAEAAAALATANAEVKALPSAPTAAAPANRRRSSVTAVEILAKKMEEAQALTEAAAGASAGTSRSSTAGASHRQLPSRRASSTAAPAPQAAPLVAADNPTAPSGANPVVRICFQCAVRLVDVVCGATWGVGQPRKCDGT